MTTSRIRTRFAPSPTGFIHLGNIRSALYPWAFARATGGDFILRIEDTDLERSSQASVDVIIEGMKWLGLDHDEGPFYQTQRLDRYKEVLAQLVQAGHVYPCYTSVQELDALREAQMAAKEKPRYNGTWRPEPGKVLPAIPEGVKPVLRFKNPLTGSVIWEDKVKGKIEISNEERVTQLAVVEKELQKIDKDDLNKKNRIHPILLTNKLKIKQKNPNLSIGIIFFILSYERR